MIHQVFDQQFAILHRSNYGMAPVCTTKGDSCAVIFGTRYPLILRKVADLDNHYILIGPVYLQSKMSSISDFSRRFGKDERCEDWLDWDLPTEEIFLC